jgi:hypothetical protein
MLYAVYILGVVTGEAGNITSGRKMKALADALVLRVI